LVNTIGRVSDAGVSAEDAEMDDLGVVALQPGTRVDVRNRFQGNWSRGFEVAGFDPEGYRLLRLSDRSILPDHFSPDDVRRERRRQDFWWR
jgi:hypothetical protein